jgi:hypothetical protein
LRVGAVDWFSRWLSDVSREVVERPATISTARELQCVESGQVSVSLGGKSVADSQPRQRGGSDRTRTRKSPRRETLPTTESAVQQAIQRVAKVGVFKPERGIF